MRHALQVQMTNIPPLLHVFNLKNVKIFWKRKNWKKFSSEKCDSRSFTSFFLFCHATHPLFGSSDISDPLGRHETMIIFFEIEKHFKWQTLFFFNLDIL